MLNERWSPDHHEETHDLPAAPVVRRNFIAIFAVLASTPVGAQTTGSVVGSVKDSQGAVIPGATVSLISETRGTTIDAQSTDVGAFQFPSVIADRYTVRITLQGSRPQSARTSTSAQAIAWSSAASASPSAISRRR